VVGAQEQRMSLRPRARLLVVAGVAAGVLGLLAAAGLGETLVYYRTPSEVLADPALAARDDGRLRVGGLVVAGTLQRSGEVFRFRVTDGVRDLLVEHRGTTPAVLQEGQGAIVEGRLSSAGVLLADTVLVKHSNEYRPVDEPAAGTR
jgi:cytochrome c-type biogenesis protein CcmE